MPLKKHELTQKQKDGRLKFWKENIDHDLNKQFLLMKLYLELKKISKENGKIRESMEFYITALKKR